MRGHQGSRRGDGGDADRLLLARIADGDAGALRSLYESHAPWLGARLRRRCADPGLVDEVVQDTFVAAWQGAGRFRGEGDVAAWVWGIAIRKLVSALRRAGSPYRVVDWDAAQVEGARVIHGLQEPSAEDLVLLAVEHGDLAVALSGLSADMRAVVQVIVLDGLTTREAAHVLGIKENTVKTRLHRARRHLQAALAEAQP